MTAIQFEVAVAIVCLVALVVGQILTRSGWYKKDVTAGKTSLLNILNVGAPLIGVVPVFMHLVFVLAANIFVIGSSMGAPVSNASNPGVLMFWLLLMIR